jgi:hypothetical protein
MTKNPRLSGQISRRGRRRWLRRFAVILVAMWAGMVIYKAADKGMQVWLPGYIAWAQHHRDGAGRVTDVMFIFVDHFEPAGSRRVMDAWCREYPALAARHLDSDGRHPQHTWFYPAEQFRLGEARVLAQMAHDGYGEVEIHLHHHDDTAATLRAKLRAAKRDFARIGALGMMNGKPAFAFVHGNWALDNSRPSSHGRRYYCGVSTELRALAQEGCYADFTFPCLNVCQPRMVNRIYYAHDDDHPKSYDTGTPVTVGRQVSGDLMLVQGPLLIDLGKWHYGLYPVIDHGDIQGNNPPTPRRVANWLRAGISVEGRPEWVFIKVYAHGALADARRVIFGGAADRMFTDLERKLKDGNRRRLHYVTAREAYNIIRAAEDGRAGNPTRYRDYQVKPPRCLRAGSAPKETAQ